ncbi:MAG: ketoacyl-ACP synthase III [Bacteroidetes bacterium]|uniref:Ketoacyl-ACP synthase III n=1 Tax=Candidatus Merdivivens pullicola TaxID=2840872 RepID=A0A9D9IH62_9BACT|nr:ketoacyl-ACP synthase III [Candidatus Merdivivens pullicola]
MKIIGTGSSLPKKEVTNDMLSTFLDTSDEWIVTRTGISSRKVISDEKLEDLATDAARKAVEDAGITLDDIDIIICSNVVNEFVTPGLSCVIQRELGTRVATMDINAACAGFIYGLDFAHGYSLAHPDVRNILLVCAEEPTRMMNWADRNVCVLFGDGAAAVVLDCTDKENDCVREVKLSGVAAVESLYYKRVLEPTPYITKEKEPVPLTMNGREIFRMATRAGVADISALLERAGIKADDVDYYLLHQANLRIIDSIQKHFDISPDKFVHNIEHLGNTSSASVPILLDDMNKAGRLKKGQKLIMSAFGAGFVSGAAYIIWDK